MRWCARSTRRRSRRRRPPTRPWPGARRSARSKGVPITTKVNVDQTGCPTDNGVVSVQITAGRFREDLCLEAAAAIEARAPMATPIDPR